MEERVNTLPTSCRSRVHYLIDKNRTGSVVEMCQEQFRLQSQHAYVMIYYGFSIVINRRALGSYS